MHGRMTHARNPDAWVRLGQRLCDSRNGVKCLWIGGGEDEGKDENLSAFLRGVDQFLARAARLPAEDQASPDGVLGSFPRPEPGGDRTGDPGEATGPDLPAP